MESILVCLLPSWVNRVLQVGETILFVELQVVSLASNQQVRQEQQKHTALKMKALEVFTEKFLSIREVLTQAQILQVCASHVATV